MLRSTLCSLFHALHSRAEKGPFEECWDEADPLRQVKIDTLREFNDSWNQRLMLGPPAAATSSRAVVADELTTMSDDVAAAALAVASSPSSWAARCSAFGPFRFDCCTLVRLGYVVISLCVSFVARGVVYHYNRRTYRAGETKRVRLEKWLRTVQYIAIALYSGLHCTSTKWPLRVIFPNICAPSHIITSHHSTSYTSPVGEIPIG